MTSLCTALRTGMSALGREYAFVVMKNRLQLRILRDVRRLINTGRLCRAARKAANADNRTNSLPLTKASSDQN